MSSCCLQARQSPNWRLNPGHCVQHSLKKSFISLSLYLSLYIYEVFHFLMSLYERTETGLETGTPMAQLGPGCGWPGQEASINFPLESTGENDYFFFSVIYFPFLCSHIAPGSSGLFIRSRHPTRELMCLKKTQFILSTIGRGMRICTEKQQIQKKVTEQQVQTYWRKYPFSLCLEYRSLLLHSATRSLQVTLSNTLFPYQCA